MNFVDLTPEKIAELKAMQVCSGVGIARLLSGRKDKPKGLSKGTVDNWFGGGVRSARADHLAYVEKLWSEVEPVIKVSDETRALLRSERERTGKGAIALYKSMNVPDGLNSRKIEHVLGGTQKTIEASHLKCIIEAYAALPDKPAPSRKYRPWYRE